MQGKLEQHGNYELFETTQGHQILNLSNQAFYAVVEGQKGDILVHSNSDHKKKRTIGHGIFYLANFKQDPEFNDVPHLFLERSKNQFNQWLLPQGLPTSSDHQKKLLRTTESVSKDKVIFHVEGEGNKGREKQYRDTEKHAASEKEAAGHGGQHNADKLSTQSKDELYKLAKQKGIAGRSKMTKAELIKALR